MRALRALGDYKKQLGQGAGVDAPKWIVRAARLGYAARGIVYLLVGGLAILAALGRGGGTGDTKDALRATLSAPGGWALLAALAAGLVAFAGWRAFQAAVDPDHGEVDAKAVARRVGFAVSAITYLLLAVAASRLAWGSGAGGGSDTDSWTAWLMNQPFGRWMVGILGAVVIGIGVGMIVKAWRRKYERYLDLGHPLMQKLRPVCRFGIAARGAVFFVIGGFFLYAAYTYDPSKAGGLREVFGEVSAQPFGQVLLGVLAAGLFSFGVYGLVQARYRRVGTHKPAG
ncbi:MAG TPA: DUF1206 domain-containing protein [Tepidisphaeraceae bacterium]|jgi:hypothetical protein